MSLFQHYQVEQLPIFGTPFGLDENGQEIDDVGGGSIKSTVEYMIETVRQREDQRLPPHLPSGEREQRIASAGQEALEHLIEMLTPSLDTLNHHISGDYLLNPNNHYSYEFSLVVGEYAKAISGDAKFYFNRGTRSVPQSLIWLCRPLSTTQVYQVLPRLTSKFVKTDMRVGQVTPGRAVIEWWPEREAEHLPEQYRQAYINMGCQVYKGLFSVTPQVSAGLPPATARDLRCRLDGDECCQWEFTWDVEQTSRDWRPWLGLTGSLALLILSLVTSGPISRILGLLVAVPGLVGWYSSQLRTSRVAETRQATLLQEQQQAMESQIDDLHTAHREIQTANAELEARMTEMTTLHRHIREIARDLDGAASTILTATSQQLSGASEQSAAISQTTTTIDQLRSIADLSVNQAQEVADASQHTLEASRTGQQAVDKTIVSMGQIKELVTSIAENILALSERALQISQIITTVSDIAAQSNMLALNASVEAARAAEHGQGFAVVAAEVRSLAEQSRQATDQVRAILSDIQKAINATVMTTEEGAKGVDHGSQMASKAGESIEQLTIVIEESARSAMQMVVGGRQQATGVDQIAVAMQNIQQVSNQNLESARQVEQATRHLSALAHSLTKMVEQYQSTSENVSKNE